jgi:Tol biopolymer transport system component
MSPHPTVPDTAADSTTRLLDAALLDAAKGLVLFASIAGLALTASATAQETSRVAIAWNGAQASAPTQFPEISADGRYVVFNSTAPLVPGDTNQTDDVYIRDRVLGTTQRVSLSSAGAEPDDYSYAGPVSADGRYVLFGSYATNLVPGDTNGAIDVFLRDRLLATTERINVATGGAQGNLNSNEWMSMSDDARFVVFSSLANNLVPGDTNGGWDVFVRDRQLGTTARVSVQSNGVQAQGGSVGADVSADGRFVVFRSGASDLVPGDTNSREDIFVRDRQLGTTERINVGPSGVEANDSSDDRPSISADGRFVVFDSNASNLVPGDTNTAADIFLRDRQAAVTTRVSVANGGVQANGASPYGRISKNGNSVTFDSLASNLVLGDTNNLRDSFVHDRPSATTERISVSSAGTESNGISYLPAPSADARFVAFWSGASNLVPGDTNGFPEPFLRDRAASSFTSLCGPGADGVIGCPCANAPSGPGRGCDNSIGSGGALLAASGSAYLASDSLVLTSTGELPSATSIFLQGNQAVAAGVVFGQGVRCVGGSLKRLFVKNASAGSVSAPSFAGGDPSISTRSAQLGDPIQPGDRRWYLVYYRDPVVLGGCPAASTFNATETGLVDWSF